MNVRARSEKDVRTCETKGPGGGSLADLRLAISSDEGGHSMFA